MIFVDTRVGDGDDGGSHFDIGSGGSGGDCWEDGGSDVVCWSCDSEELENTVCML